jgi:uncharacterized protein YqgV (UPF0045/DUF77 family)
MSEDKHKVNLSLQVVPIDCSNSYEVIDSAIASIDASGIRYEVQPFSTIMEGKLDELLKTVLDAKEAALNNGANELLLNIQIHLKKDEDVSFEDKTEKFKDNKD